MGGVAEVKAMRILVVMLLTIFLVGTVDAAQVVLTLVDSPTLKGRIIQRKLYAEPESAYATLGYTSDQPRFIDGTAKDGVFYCYRMSQAPGDLTAWSEPLCMLPTPKISR